MEIVRPTLLLDKEICLSNIGNMVQKAQKLNLAFRPHFKTHQSAKIGEWFRMAGVKAITVSSVTMAEYFAAHGWDDITIAFPVNILEIDSINELAERISLNLLVENRESLSFLTKFIKFPVGLFIKIDTGYNRTGISPSRTNQIDALLDQIRRYPLLKFKGFLSHTGQSYKAKSKYEIFNLHYEVLLKMKELKESYREYYPNIQISLGDTPTCSICDNFDGIDEIRPGNFVFYDLMQAQLGSCSVEDIAIRVACPVVACHPSRSEVVIYGGAVHLSKESIANTNGKPLYGRVVIYRDNEPILLDDKTYVCALSQEHGIIKAQQEDFKLFKVGDLIEILPVHSCLTANLAGQYITTQGEVISMMRY